MDLLISVLLKLYASDEKWVWSQIILSSGTICLLYLLFFPRTAEYFYLKLYYNSYSYKTYVILLYEVVLCHKTIFIYCLVFARNCAHVSLFMSLFFTHVWHNMFLSIRYDEHQCEFSKFLKSSIIVLWRHVWMIVLIILDWLSPTAFNLYLGTNWKSFCKDAEHKIQIKKNHHVYGTMLP